MTWLAFLISIAYIPGWTGIAIPTGWAAMSLTLPWAVWRPTRLTQLHWLGAAFLAYAFWSLRWAPRSDDGINELWHLSALAFAFLLGSKVPLAGLWRGLAWGCAVSSALAVAQWFGGHGFDLVPQSDWGKPSGLFYNSAVAGAVAAIVIVANRGTLWAWAPVPLLLLSQSRGAWLALAVVVFLCAERWMKVLLACLALPLGFLAWPYLASATDSIRLEIWTHLLANLTLWGHGAGSMMSIYLAGDKQIFHIEHAHNDYISLAYTYGIGCLPLAAMVGACGFSRAHREWPILACCAVLSAYFWTLEVPVPAFAFALVTGRMCADVGVAWSDLYHWGLGRLPRRDGARSLVGATRDNHVPV